MSLQIFRQKMFTGAAVGMVWAIANAAPANADTICTAETSIGTSSFDCADGSVEAAGTFTTGAAAYLSAGGLVLGSGQALDVKLESGQIITTGDFERAIYLHASNELNGALTYTSDGITTTSGRGENTLLLGYSVTASTGTVVATAASGAFGVVSTALNGDNFTTSQSTTVTGSASGGIWTQAVNGENITNTGDVFTPNGSGVFAQAIAQTDCGSVTVNVTGDITSAKAGVFAWGCGNTSINVLEGNTMSRTSSVEVGTVINGAAGEAVTTIAGNVSALTPGNLAVEVKGTSTLTTISSTGALQGSFYSVAGEDAFNLNGGATWNTASVSYFQDGDDVINNFGTIRIEYGSATFEGLELLANSGTIDLVGGNVGDSLTVEGDYAGGPGASLWVDAGGAEADRLVIAGNASGTTSVFVNTQSIISTPILIVDAGTSAPGAFVLGATAATPLLDLNLTQSGGEFFVTALPSDAAYQPALVGPVARDNWYQSADAYTAYAVLRRSDLGADRKDRIGLWAQFYGGNDKRGGRKTQIVFGSEVNIDGRVKTDRRGAQAGIDYRVGNSFVVGVTGGYAQARADQDDAIGDGVADGHNFGIYGQYGRAAGFHAGLLAKKDWIDVRLTSSAFDSANGDPDTTITGLESEVGYRMTMKGVAVDFGAGLAYVKTNVDGFTAGGIDFHINDGKSLRGRVGARGVFGGSLGLFADAKLYHEFEGDSELTLVSGTETDSLELDGRGTWARFEAGFGSRMKSGPMLSAWVDVGDVKGMGVTAGLRF